MVRRVLILFLMIPTIVFAGKYSKIGWNTFLSSMFVGVLLIVGITIFEVVIRKLFGELGRFLGVDTLDKKAPKRKMDIVNKTNKKQIKRKIK